MRDAYKPCPCGSGKKFKFCCVKLIKSSEPNKLLKEAASFRLYETVITENWQEQGLASIYVVRQLPNLRYIFCGYIVDYFCLGLKNAFCRMSVPYTQIQQMKSQNPVKIIDFPYQDARSLILGSIQYAANLGFHPHEDWHLSKNMVESSKPYEKKYEYGKDGKPFYISGPNDDAQAIIKKLSDVDHHYTIVNRGVPEVVKRLQ